jgi:hypothetical protein
MQQLDLFTPLIDEDKHIPIQGIAARGVLLRCWQAIKAFTQIRWQDAGFFAWTNKIRVIKSEIITRQEVLRGVL